MTITDSRNKNLDRIILISNQDERDSSKAIFSSYQDFFRGEKGNSRHGTMWILGSDTAHPESDINISFIVTDPEHFRNGNWFDDLEFSKINEEIDQFEDKTYGVVWSRHVFLRSGSEIELSFARLNWVDTKNLD